MLPSAGCSTFPGCAAQEIVKSFEWSATTADEVNRHRCRSGLCVAMGDPASYLRSCITPTAAAWLPAPPAVCAVWWAVK